MTLGFSTYALPRMSALEAMKTISYAGYESVELCVFPPRAIPSPGEQQDISNFLKSSKLKLTSLMENLKPLSTENDFQESTERLKRACEFANQFAGGIPLIQTVLGGKDWESQRERCRDRLATWQDIATNAEVVLAIKPHRGHAMSRPSEAIWMIRELGDSPWLRMCFDYSHFIYRDMPMHSVVKESLPYTAHIAVKDAIQQNGKVIFKSPGGAGTIDYAALLRQFHAGGYRGDVSVEVSSQVWKEPKYAAVMTLQNCYAVFEQAFTAAELRALRAASKSFLCRAISSSGSSWPTTRSRLIS